MRRKPKEDSRGFALAFWRIFLRIFGFISEDFCLDLDSLKLKNCLIVLISVIQLEFQNETWTLPPLDEEDSRHRTNEDIERQPEISAMERISRKTNFDSPRIEVIFLSIMNP
jgi:hypothetical protein